MPLNGNEFSDDDDDDDDEKDYVENESGTEENVYCELSSDTCSDNWSIGMPAIRFILVKCMKKHL